MSSNERRIASRPRSRWRPERLVDDRLLEAPRGAGKSTWLHAAFPNAHRIDLLDEGLYQSYLADPAAFAGELRALPPRVPVALDEIQRLPALLNEVHRQMEERRGRFVLCGSSACSPSGFQPSRRSCACARGATRSSTGRTRVCRGR